MSIQDVTEGYTSLYKLIAELHDAVDPDDFAGICLSSSDLNNVWDLAWHPNSKYIASAHGDCAARIWRIEGQGQGLVHRLPHQKFVASVAWHPGGQFLATGDTQADPIRIWNVQTGEQLEELYEHDSWPLSIDWRFDGHAFVSSSLDGRVLRWRMNPWQVVEELQPTKSSLYEMISCVRYSPDARYVVFSTGGYNTFVVINGITYQLTFENSKPHKFGQHIAFSRHRSHVAAILDSNNNVEIWNLSKRTKIADMPQHHPMPLDGNFRFIDWHPHGHMLAVVGGDNLLRLWNHGAVVQPFEAHSDIINVAKWSPDGRYIALGGENGVIRILGEH